MAANRNKSIVVAATPNMVPLSVLKANQEGVSITVRVIRSWEVFFQSSGGRPSAVEMVLVDNEGTKILGRLEQSHIYKFGDLLREGSVVNISNFALLPANGAYRPTIHDCKLSIKYHSVIVPVPTTEVDLPPYNFTPPEYCFDKDFNKNFLVDVVGVYIRNGDVTEFVTKGRRSTRMTVDLQNQGTPFTVTLFGEYTAQMKEFVDSGRAPGAVIAVLFCKVGTWPGGTSIQTTQRTSKLLINPDIPEAVALRESSQALTVTPLSTTRQHRSQSVEESFLSMDKMYTLADIRELLEINDFVTTATIGSIIDGIEWVYWACSKDQYKCREEEDAPGEFYCPKCNIHVESVVRKLFLKMYLHDHTECITVTLFDNIVKMLTGRSTEEVYQAWSQDPARGKYPTEISQLIGREGIWRISAVKKEDGCFGRSYKVTRASLAEEVINKYREKWALEATIEGSKQLPLLIEGTPSCGVDSATNSDNIGVTQDLIQKFEDSGSGSTNFGAAVAMVDLSKDTDETPPTKRKAELDAASSSKISIKNIKIEKQ